MAQEALRFVIDGGFLKILTRIWGQDHLEHLWTELTQTETTKRKIAAGQLQSNKAKQN
jgi:hypothetical protein